MLAPSNRLTSSEEFRRAVRRGVRAGSDALVVHWLPSDDEAPVRTGFVVSKAVGNAVQRNRVKRRLRHLTREQLVVLPGSGVLVVRAQPTAARASFAALDQQLRSCLRRVAVRAAAEVSAP